jgi:type VI secretion system protein ImpH
MSRHLTARIAEEAARYGFFELTRALEQALQCDATPGDSPALERVRFKEPPSLAFPTAEARVTSEEGEGAEIAVSFLGLLGTASPLSPEWTEEVLLGDEDGALQAFYDVFHHRALSYLFLAWKTHSAEGAFDLHGRDTLSQRLRSLAGIDAFAPADDDPLPPMMALGVADHQFGQAQTIDRDAAEQLLRRTFPWCPLRLETEVRRSVALTTEERAKLGVRNSKLDGGLVYGSRCDDEGGLVRIHLGPVDGPAYESMMPGGSGYATLERLAFRIFDGSVDVEIEVHVQPGAAPSTTLGEVRGSRLGIDSRFASPPSAALSVRVPLVADGLPAPRTFVVQHEGA